MAFNYRIRQKSSDYRTTFSTPEGKRVLLDLCKSHKVFDSTFHKDERIHLLQEGERNAVLRLLTIMGYSDQDLLRMSQQEIIYNEDSDEIV